MELVDLCFVYIYILCMCVCVFVSCNTTFLFDYHAHSLNPEKTTCLCNSFTQTGLISSGYDARRSLNIPNSPHYRFFFWTISRFKAHVLTKKRDNSHKNKFCNKNYIFFSNQKAPDQPLQISETIWFTKFWILSKRVYLIVVSFRGLVKTRFEKYIISERWEVMKFHFYTNVSFKISKKRKPPTFVLN